MLRYAMRAPDAYLRVGCLRLPPSASQAQDSLVDPQVEFTAREVSLNPETGSYREL